MYSRDTAQPCPFHRFGLWWSVWLRTRNLSTASGPPLLSGEALCPYESFSDFVSWPRLKGEVARSDGEVEQSERSVTIIKPYLACPEREGGTRSVTEGFFNSTLHTLSSILHLKLLTSLDICCIIHRILSKGYD